MEMTMYDTLLQLPLFQGLGKNDFTVILEKVKMHFSKHKSGETIVKKEQRCRELIFLLNGTLQSETVDPNGLFTLYETIQAPFLIEPYSLFGKRTEYTARYTTLTECNLITIDKSYLLSDLNHYEIIRFNILNILSNRAQTLNDKLWSSPSDRLDERIIDFILMHCSIPSGEKQLKIKMDVFATLLDSTRIRISKALNDMQARGLLTLHRGEIRIPDIASLMNEREPSLTITHK